MKKYFRTITAHLPKSNNKYVNKRYFAIYLRRFLFLFFVLLAGVLLQLLVILNARYVEASKVYASKSEEFVYWTSVASQFPNIPDVLYNAALSSIAMGREEDAINFVNKALKIDPLFEKANELKQEISRM